MRFGQRAGLEPRVAVLGGGVCGLYAARCLSRAGADVTLIERGVEVGGLAAGHRRGDNFYDLGVHHLHAFDREIFEDVRAMMGERMIAVQKDARIRYGRGFRRYPLEFVDLLTGIPVLTLARALAGLAVQQAVNRARPREASNAEEALIQLYGQPLYRFFFREFTARYWGMPPSELSAAFVRRKMPRLSAVDVLKRALAGLGFRESEGAAVEGALSRETLYYGPTGSREMPLAIARAIEGAGGRVLTQHTVTAVEVEGGRAVAVLAAGPNGSAVRIEVDAVLSTIPVNVLARMVEPPAPAPVLAAAGRLRHRPMVVYGMRVRRPRVLDALYVYYRDRSFHRLAEPKSSGLVVHPREHTLLLVELMCEIDDPIWRADPAAVERVMADLESEGVLEREEVEELHVVREEHAYPVFELGFEAPLGRVQEWLAGIANLRSTGRQGAFCYPNMHVSMRMGAREAEALLELTARAATRASNTAAGRAAPTRVPPAPDLAGLAAAETSRPATPAEERRGGAPAPAAVARDHGDSHVP